MLVWVRLTAVAHEAWQTIYGVERGLVSESVIQQLRSPTVGIAFA